MIRNLKALGLAAFAVLAMGALFASGASAQEHEGWFTAGATPEDHAAGTIFGEQLKEYEGVEVENKFTAAGNEVECEIAEFHGNVSGTDKELTIFPTYKDCTASGLAATVHMNECHYTFDAPTTEEGLPEGEYTGTVDLWCPKGQTVDIEIFLFGGSTSHSFKVCTMTVEPFETLGHVIYRTEETPNEDDDVIVEATVEEIPFVEHNQACEAGEQTIPHTTGGKGSKEGAVYESIVRVEGAEDVTDVWISE